MLLSERYLLLESLELTIDLVTEFRIELKIFFVCRELFYLFYFLNYCLESRCPFGCSKSWLFLLLALFLLLLFILLLFGVYYFDLWIVTLRIISQHFQRIMGLNVSAHLAREFLGVLDVLRLNLILNSYIS